jgi:glycosyltransferase involved in cell wall biosynthesis
VSIGSTELRDSTFIVWASRHRGTRSSWLAGELGIRDVRFLGPDNTGSGLPAALLKYPSLLVKTTLLLAARRPKVVFVQCPPSYAGWVVAAYAAVTDAAVVIDAHSQLFQRPIWQRPAWVVRRMARRSAAILVTDEFWAAKVRSWGGHAIVVPSIPAMLQPGVPPPLAPSRAHVAVVQSASADEPLREILMAAASMPEVTFHVTGCTNKLAALIRTAPGHVRFTGLLDEPTYLGLLASVDAVVSLTTRDHTMQSAATEALMLGTPILTSDWPILRDYFPRGAVLTDNTVSSIEAGLRRLLAERDAYRSAMLDLRAERTARWAEIRQQLLELLKPSAISGQRACARHAAR